MVVTAPDTFAAGGGRTFPATRHSLVAALGGGDSEVRRRAFGTLVAAYWKPVYKYLRVRWRLSGEDAEDLTQEFFTRALEKGFFDRYDPLRARFRTFLRTCVDRFAAKEHRSAGRLKRGGGAALVSLDFAGAEGELAARPLPDPLDVEEFFQREWMRSFFEVVVEALRRRCEESGKALPFTLFERYDLEPSGGGERPTYARLAADLDIPVTQVTNQLAWVRRELRRLTLEKLRELTGSDEEFRAEARLVLGVDPP